MIKKVAVVTSIAPNKLNSDGRPSGLIWEIINEYKNHNVDVDTVIIPQTANKFMRVLHRYGIYFSRISNFEKYDRIIVYPEYLSMAISSKYSSKMIVLGPDSPSLRDSRIYKFMHRGLFRYVKLLYKYVSYVHEYHVASHASRFVVVGRVDQLWMKRNPLIKNNKKLIDRVKFLHHPLLNNVIKKDTKIEISNIDRVFVFAGDLSYLHNYKFIECVINELQKRCTGVSILPEVKFVVLGKQNKWISIQLNKVPGCQVHQIDWIENYSDMCVPGKHVHCLPILVGSGTKNRTLTALASGLEVITTPVGIENIPWRGLSECFITRNPSRFVDYILRLNQCGFDNEKWNVIKLEREHFINKVTTLFKDDFIKYFLE